MKSAIKILVVLTFTFYLGGKLNAHEVKSSALEEANREHAIYCMEILENRPDLEISHRISILRNECYSENFIEHAPNIDGGREVLLSLFEKRYKKYPELSMSIKRTASEGDLVWIHLHVKHTPESLGAAGIHIFRMRDGKIVEHWDTTEEVPPVDLWQNNNGKFVTLQPSEVIWADLA